MSREIKLKISSRDYYLRCAKRIYSELDWSTYKRMRNNVTNIIRHAKANYIRKLFRESVSNPKDFWNQIKKAYPIKERGNISKTIKVNDTLTSDKAKISNAFCSYFATIGSTLSNQIISLSNLTWKLFDGRGNLKQFNPNNVVFKFKTVEIRDVVLILRSIKSSKAAGFDNIPGLLIRDAADELAAPIAFLVDFSFQSGVFPTAEKIAKVTPLYKSSDRSSLDNYRPISVLNIVSKVIERIAYKQLMDYLENNNFLCPRQYGFRRNRSTQDAVIQLVDHFRESSDKGKFTGAL